MKVEGRRLLNERTHVVHSLKGGTPRGDFKRCKWCAKEA